VETPGHRRQPGTYALRRNDRAEKGKNPERDAHERGGGRHHIPLLAPDAVVRAILDVLDAAVTCRRLTQNSSNAAKAKRQEGIDAARARRCVAIGTMLASSSELCLSAGTGFAPVSTARVNAPASTAMTGEPTCRSKRLRIEYLHWNDRWMD